MLVIYATQLVEIPVAFTAPNRHAHPRRPSASEFITTWKQIACNLSQFGLSQNEQSSFHGKSSEAKDGNKEGFLRNPGSFERNWLAYRVEIRMLQSMPHILQQGVRKAISTLQHSTMNGQEWLNSLAAVLIHRQRGPRYDTATERVSFYWPDGQN